MERERDKTKKQNQSEKEREREREKRLTKKQGETERERERVCVRRACILGKSGTSDCLVAQHRSIPTASSAAFACHAKSQSPPGTGWYPQTRLRRCETCEAGLDWQFTESLFACQSLRQSDRYPGKGGRRSCIASARARRHDSVDGRHVRTVAASPHPGQRNPPGRRRRSQKGMAGTRGPPPPGP